MTRNIKSLALALVAVFALSALVAAGTQAAEFEAEEGAESVMAVGGLQVFESGSGKFTCEGVNGTAAYSGPSSTSTLENIEYSNCHATALKFPVTIDMNGCHYTFSVSEQVEEGTYEGSSKIEGCENEEAGITITIFTGAHTPENLGCTMHVKGGQSFPVTYHNDTFFDEKEEIERMDVTATTNGIEIHYQFTKGPKSLCTDHTEFAKYTGETTFTATDGEGNTYDLTVVG